jgi:hypothetical protein
VLYKQWLGGFITDASAKDRYATMTCDQFTLLIQRDPKACSIVDIGFAQKHYLECARCQKLVSLDEHSMAWRFAWAELDADTKKGATRMVGGVLALTICFVLGFFLRGCFSR